MSQAYKYEYYNKHSAMHQWLQHKPAMITHQFRPTSLVPNKIKAHKLFHQNTHLKKTNLHSDAIPKWRGPPEFRGLAYITTNKNGLVHHNFQDLYLVPTKSERNPILTGWFYNPCQLIIRGPPTSLYIKRIQSLWKKKPEEYRYSAQIILNVT